VYNPVTGWAEGNGVPVNGPIEYLVQAVDAKGNVALALDHGNPFTEVTMGGYKVYLPITLR
jgi:hypothetical protein